MCLLLIIPFAFPKSSTNVSNSQMNCFGLLEGSILLAACGSKELLPMNPKLPADLFTACLTTPVKTALLWYLCVNYTFCSISVHYFIL